MLNFNNNLKNKSTLLIEVLLKTIDKMGITKTIQVLEVSQNYTDKEKLLIQTIVLNSCKYFDIDEKTLFNGRKNTANRINAIGVASVLLHRHCNISQREISNILKKDATLINRYIKKYQSLDPNFKLDAIVIEKMEQIKIESLKNCEIN